MKIHTHTHISINHGLNLQISYIPYIPYKKYDTYICIYRLVSHCHLPGDSEKLLCFSFLDFIQVASNIKFPFLNTAFHPYPPSHTRTCKSCEKVKFHKDRKTSKESAKRSVMKIKSLDDQHQHDME